MAVRPYIPTLVACALTALVSAPVHCGFVLLALSPVLAIWFIYSGIVMVRHPQRRTSQAAKLACWAGVVLVVSALHVVYYLAARQAGTDALAAVLAYKKAHGIYPQRLQDAGSDLDRADADWRVVYMLDQGQPLLLYGGTLTVFETYTYDFAQQRWRYQP